MNSRTLKTSPIAKPQPVTKPAAAPPTKPASRIAKTTASTSNAPSNPAKVKQSLSGIDAAYRVLQESREPMNLRDITERAMSKGWWSPAGKTPTATLAAAIGREIRTKSKHARFKKADRGLYSAVTSKK